MNNLDDNELRRLVEVCQQFIIDNRISCPEATIEDRVYENAPDLIGTICEIIGYYEYPDDDSEEG